VLDWPRRSEADDIFPRNVSLTYPDIQGKILVCVFGHSSTTHAEES
jgi:hypothetical protein